MSLEADITGQQPVLVPVSKPLSLIPVGLKEAALDSPSFRATVVHFSDQIDAVERWLEGVLKAAAKLSQEVTALESAVQSYLTHTAVPNHLSEAAMDHDYTLQALRRYNEGAREFWSYTVGGLKRTQHYMVDPIRGFLNTEVRPYKEARRQLDTAQKFYDTTLARYQSQGKTKEPSALREDAFQVHESRKAYLKSSMDVCVLGPQVRAALDTLLIKVFTDQWLEMKRIREESTTAFKKTGTEMDRIRSWSNEMREGESVLRRELLLARREIESCAEKSVRPTRDLDAYAASTVPYLSSSNPQTRQDGPSSKQGYLYMKSTVGKPARTQWVRRWCFCKNSVFGWLVQGAKSGGVEESEKIGVLLCSVRPAFQEERRFCFEVKTKDSTTVLQAETQEELTEWIAVFEIVKRKVLEEPENADMIANMSSPSGDAAFAVNPPTAPELAAQDTVGTLTGTTLTDEPTSTSLGADLADPHGIASRASFDVSALRKGDAERERTRDRIIQKLDLHKKSAADAQVSGTTTQSSSALPAGGGIASLIAASHSTLTVGPGRPPVLQTKDRSVSGPQITTTLAPDSLANPPSQTNLTKTALLVGLDRGYDLGLVDNSGGMPSGLMANQWGTINHGQLARIDRGEVKQLDTQASPPVSITEKHIPHEEALEATASAPGSAKPSPSGTPAVSPAPLGHRKTLSAADDLQKHQNFQRKVTRQFAEFPSYYPAPLRAHDAQFRMLFPNIDPEERVVLIFRASWNPSENQDLPGRAYVTTKNLYFYSHHFGLVLVSGLSLDNIIDVSSAAGRAHDMLYIKIRLRDALGDDTIIPVKTFLEPLRLLQRRLNFLINNNNTEEPYGLEEVLKQLISMEKDTSNDLGPLDTVESPFVDNYSLPVQPSRREIGLRVDRTPYGGDSAAFVENEVTRFRLPAHPVNYVPPHFTDCAASKVYNVSAKALFHIMFGDKSALFQLLYRERRAQSVRQSPWVKSDDEHFSRTFDYTVQATDSLQRSRTVSVSDKQVIDVNNDHLCYVITDLKTPWHLPQSQNFSMVTKIVITHMAKSKSKLAIYTRVEWLALPWLSKSLIETQALDDMHLDSLDIVDLVTDQVDKLGPNTYTKKALAIFGPIGVATEASQIVSADPSVIGKPVRLAIKRKSIIGLFFEVLQSFGASAVSTILMSMIGLVKAILKVFTMHTLLMALLGLSALTNFLGTTTVVREWWHDRTTAAFAARLGVRPDMVLGKAIYLKDLDQLALPSSVYQPTNDTTTGLFAAPDSKCALTFQDILARAVPGSSTSSALKLTEPSTRATARRLERVRRRLGAYRHDLLVGLRLVNAIERDAVQAEYEAWLSAETDRCDQVRRFLTVSPSSKSTAVGGAKDASVKEQLARRLGVEGGSRALQTWIDEYCASCGRDMEAVETVARRG